MLIYEIDSKVYCYIHIPKNSGRFYRNEIINKIKGNSDSNKIIKSYWGLGNDLDLAHIPYMLRKTYIEPLKQENIFYYAHTRSPYDRLISAYFYKNNKSKTHFKTFINTELIHFDFNTKFTPDIIHYYPQYLFLCDEDFTIKDDVNIQNIESVLPKARKYKLSDYFDNNNIQIINKIYELDFKLFNYEIITEI